MSRTFSIEELLAHSGWLRALARELTADPSLAQDLAQETWIAALRRPPRAGEPARPWLARVARNLASNARRAARTRREHEAQVIPDRHRPGPDEIAGEIEAQRSLAEALAALAEPGRSVIVLRYFRELDSAAIGAELGLPASTVRWHHGRALGELRARLDSEHGSRGAWVAWLAPFTRRPSCGPGLEPAIAWKATFLAAVGVVTLLVGVGAWWPGSEVRRQSERDSLVSRATTGIEPAVTDLAPSLDPRLRTAIESVARTPRHDLVGRVLLDGRPAALDLELRFPGEQSEPRFARSDADGRFRVAGLEQRWLSVKAPGYRFENGLAAESVYAPFTEEVELRILDGPVLTGRFLEPGTHLPIAPPPGLQGFNAFYEFHWDQFGHSSMSGVFATGEDGRFKLALRDELTRELPRVRLHVELYDVGRLVIEVPPLDERGLDLGDLELRAGRAHSYTVYEASGKPVPLAFAQHPDWKKYAQCDERGQGSLPSLPSEGAWIRFGAERHKDELRFVRPDERTDVFLERTNALTLRIASRNSTPLPALRVSITQHAELFLPTDGWANVFHPDGILTITSSERPEQQYFHADVGAGSSGRLILRDLRPGLAFQVVLSSEGRTLAERTCALAEAEWQELELLLP